MLPYRNVAPCRRADQSLRCAATDEAASAASNPMNDRTPPLAIVHNRPSRFEAVLPEGLCRADYRRVGDTMHLVHPRFRGSSRAAGSPASWSRPRSTMRQRTGLKVMPQCSYVRAYMRRHPDTHHLLAPGARV